MRPWLKAVLLIERWPGLLLKTALSVSALFLGGEIFARLSDLDLKLLRPLLYYQSAHVEVHRVSADPRLRYELKPGARGEGPSYRISINRLGFRDKEREAAKKPGVIRIICLGGSNVFGLGVDDDETFPYYLEEFLKRKLKRTVEVWNCGLNGSVLSQNVAMAEKVLEEYDPDVFIFHYSNTGRRAFLDGQPYAAFFKEDKDLFGEELKFIPWNETSWGARLLRRSAFWRVFVICLNYIGAVPQNNPRFASEDVNEKALTDFYQKQGEKHPIFLVPFWWRTQAFLNSPIKQQVRLYHPDNLPHLADLEYYEVHPPAYVHKWCAERVGEKLIESAVFDRF